MGNCASGKTAEDKDEARKKRNIDHQSHNNSNNNNSNNSNSRKRSNVDADNNRSKSSLNSQTGGARGSNTGAQQQHRDDIDAKRPPASPYGKGAAASQATPSTSSYQQTATFDDILGEFFNAVSNGDIECVEQLLASYEDKKKRRFKADLLNAGMNKADGLTALSIAAGRKHRDLTYFLSGKLLFFIIILKI